MKYQEVIPNPTFMDTVRHMRRDELVLTAAWTTLSFVAGYVVGKPIRVRMGMMAAMMSGMGGLVLCHRLSMQRLLGLRENTIELEKNGMEKKELVKVVKKRIVLPKEELLDI